MQPIRVDSETANLSEDNIEGKARRLAQVYQLLLSLVQNQIATIGIPSKDSSPSTTDDGPEESVAPDEIR